MQKTLFILGLLCIAAALVWPYLDRFPLGRLPGDIVIERPGFRFYSPITTGLLVSALISLIGYLFRK